MDKESCLNCYCKKVCWLYKQLENLHTERDFENVREFCKFYKTNEN